MTKNIGSTDKTIRLVAGIILIIIGLLPILGIAAIVGSTLAWIALIVGIVLVATALIGFCPAYTLIGFNSCKK